jgi:hypothetical protein
MCHLSCYELKFSSRDKVFLQGNVDHEGLVNGRLNAGWSQNHVSKVQLQVNYLMFISPNVSDDKNLVRAKQGNG